MIYSEYIFRCVFETDALLSCHKGSGIRGLFGHCLKKVTCAQRQSECHTCLLAPSCVYYRIFESPGRQEKSMAGVNVLPHPFVLVPPLDTRKREYAPGDSFTIQFKLFGPAVDWLPYIVYCVEQMGRTGLGARIRQGLGRFSLEEVSCGGTRVYSKKQRMLIQDDGYKKELALQNFEPVSVNSIRIFFVTPLRIKSRNQLTDKMDFQTLIRACIRRIAILESAFGQGEPDIDYTGLVKQADAVETVTSDIRWEKVQRYSSRQKKKMSIGGITGMATFCGELSEFMPLLKYCEVVHIGKQTAFGHGKTLVIEESDTS